MRSSFLIAAIAVAASAAVASTTIVRCRTGDGRIYIGPEPPGDCEIEATYAPTVPPEPTVPAAPPTPAATRARPAATPRPTPPPRAKPARPQAPRRVVRATPVPRGAPAAGAPTPAPAPVERGGAPAGLAEKRARLERSLDRVLLELARLERRIRARTPPARAGAPATEPARLRAEAQRRFELEPLRRRQGELRLRRDRIRAEFAELTGRVALANGGELPEWWPPELRCRRCP